MMGFVIEGFRAEGYKCFSFQGFWNITNVFFCKVIRKLNSQTQKQLQDKYVEI